MADACELLKSIDKIHTTELGKERIGKNLGLTVPDAAEYCKNIITSPNCRIVRKGKNWYCEADGIIITVNAHSKTVITAHRIKEKTAAEVPFLPDGDGISK